MFQYGHQKFKPTTRKHSHPEMAITAVIEGNTIWIVKTVKIDGCIRAYVTVIEKSGIYIIMCVLDGNKRASIALWCCWVVSFGKGKGSCSILIQVRPLTLRPENNVDVATPQKNNILPRDKKNGKS